MESSGRPSLLAYDDWDPMYALQQTLCQFIVMQFGSFRGSIPSESIQNRAHAVCAPLYDVVVGGQFNRKWHLFVQRNQGRP